MQRVSHGFRNRFLARVVAGLGGLCVTVLCEGTSGAYGFPISGEEPAPAAVWPVDPHPVVAPFDPPGCAYCPGHRGVDLGTSPLSPVRAVLPGTITFAGPLAGRGVIVIDDGVRRLTYEPVLASVAKGTHADPGEVIGTLELAFSHCYPDACLHLGLLQDSDDGYLDPLSLFAPPRPVRLLPLWDEAPSLFTSLFVR